MGDRKGTYINILWGKTKSFCRSVVYNPYFGYTYLIGLIIAISAKNWYAFYFGLSLVIIWMVWRVWRGRELLGNAAEMVFMLLFGKPSIPELWEKGEMKTKLKKGDILNNPRPKKEVKDAKT